MKKLILVWSLIILLILAGCNGQGDSLFPESYTVTFVMKGHVLSTQTVRAGELPSDVSTNVPGLRFEVWNDENGKPVNPYVNFVYRDLRYEAVAYPQLSNHVPYLFADENEYLHPDEPMTADALYQALHALAPQEAWEYFPGMPMGDYALTAEELMGIMEAFFSPERVTEAFGEPTDAPMTRAAFAAGMHLLLGRDSNETLSMDADVPLPHDLTRERDDAVILLEACMLHTPYTGEHVWAQLELPVQYAPGLVNVDGWLYYVKDNYHFLKDDYVGMLYFGPDGRYTTGDKELDTKVAEILKRIIDENPDATRLELLKIAFDHCHMDYKYLRRNAYTFGQTGWEVTDAKTMFETGRGNCYNFAAIFWALARGLGYEARAVSGTCTGRNQPHGWVIIEIDGADYFFDPEWQFAYRNEGRIPKDMFMIPMNKISYWTYKWKE